MSEFYDVSNMRSTQILKDNIDALLTLRGLTRKDLAQWCRKTESWISKAMRNPQRTIPMKYLDRIADLLGVPAYQLLQPGVSHASERRSGQDRRSGRDRRVSLAQRAMREIAPKVSEARRRTHDAERARKHA